MIENKSYQILMDPGAHFTLKGRSKMLNLKIGELVGNMLSAYEIRMERWFDSIDLEPDRDAQREGLKMLITADAEGWTDNQIKTAFMKLKAAQFSESELGFTWTPKVILK